MLTLLRRILALLLFPVFLVLFIVTLLIWRVQGTFGNPDYIKGELAKADIYNFVYDDVAVPLVADALDTPEDFLNDDLAELEIRPDEDAEQIVGFVRDFLPPEEMQERVEHVIDEFIPYITGDADEFAIQLRLGERVRAWPELLPARFDALDAGNRLSDAALAPVLDEAFDALDERGLELSITRERARDIAQSVAPGDWLEAQVVSATQAVSGWLTREDDGFEIRIQFADRVPAATQAVKDVLDAANAEQFLFDSVIRPELTNTLGSFTELSGRVAISDEEVTDAIEAVAPIEWVREQRNALIDTLSAYLSGESERLVLTVDLEGRAEEAAGTLFDLAETKLVDVLNGVPACTSVAQGLTALQELEGGQLPSCTPPGVDAGAVVGFVAGSFRDQIESQIVAVIPDSFEFTERQLEDLVGEGIVANIEKARRWVSEGFVYTDADIQQDLVERGSEFDLDDLDVVRDVLDDDFTLTQDDFTSRLLDTEERRDDYEQIRDYMGMGRSFWWLSLLLPALIIVIIGFLGGRNWNSRLKWAMVPVFVASVAIWAATAPVYDRYAQDEIDQAVEEITADIEREDAREVATEAIDKVVNLVVRWKDGYGGLARSFAIGSGIILLLSVGYSMFGGRARPGPAGGGGGFRSSLDPQSQAAYDALKADEEVTRLGDAPGGAAGRG